MTRKKIVFVIVEGISDETALGIVFNQIFHKSSVYIHIMRGDITTRKGVNSQNIISKIGDELKRYAKSQHFTNKHFNQIIHIVDTDGAYIPDDKILVDTNSISVVYESDGIHTTNLNGIVFRNNQKRENLLKLRNCSEIWKIPYRVYYMSCNLDHVLYNKRNSTNDEKENDSYNFAKKYKNKSDEFIKFICESDFSVNDDYLKTWEYIEQGMNSIERHTNLSLCIKEEIEKNS